MDNEQVNKDVNSTITDICKYSKYAPSLSLTTFFVGGDKLYRGWWDKPCPMKISEIFDGKDNKILQWLEKNVNGATHLYYLTAFWGCEHTEYFVYEYGEGKYLVKSHTFAVT